MEILGWAVFILAWSAFSIMSIHIMIEDMWDIDDLLGGLLFLFSIISGPIAFILLCIFIKDNSIINLFREFMSKEVMKRKDVENIVAEELNKRIENEVNKVLNGSLHSQIKEAIEMNKIMGKLKWKKSTRQVRLSSGEIADRTGIETSCRIGEKEYVYFVYPKFHEGKYIYWACVLEGIIMSSIQKSTNTMSSALDIVSRHIYKSSESEIRHDSEVSNLLKLANSESEELEDYISVDEEV